MRIAIIGTGRVGSALGPALAAAGHAIVYGSRDPDRDDVQALVSRSGDGASAARPVEAVRLTDVVVLATPWEATAELVRTLADVLDGKTVLDTTNPLSYPDLEHVADPSGGELIQGWVPGARVVKAFCTIGANVMADSDFPSDVRPALLVAGDDEGAKATAIGLAEDLGFEGLDAGGIERSRALEEAAILWIHLAMRGGREFAFGALRR